MATDTTIQWTDHTFNPWSGCTKVSPGCANCYAESNYSVKMRGVKWGPNGNRVVTSETYWRSPHVWDRQAVNGVCPTCHGKGRVTVPCNEYGGENGDLMVTINRKLICTRCNGTGEVDAYRARVFCASLADIFEDWQGPMLDPKGERLCVYKPNGGVLTVAPYAEEPPANCRWLTMQDVRKRLFHLIDQTPHLDWLLLTKRPESVAKMMPPMAVCQPVYGSCKRPKGHAGLHSQDHEPRSNVWLGVSVEDQKRKDRIDLLRVIPAAVRFLSIEPLLEDLGEVDLAGIRWVIIGGESGHGVRPCNVDWVRSIVRQCKATKVPCFVKQLGSSPFGHWVRGAELPLPPGGWNLRVKDKKGGDMTEWPEDLQVRQFPEVSRA